MISTTKFRTRTLFASVVLLLALSLSLSAQTIRTVGTGGNFTTLKAAFDAINAGTITGDIELQITTNVTETATPTLYQSGYTGAGGTSSYSSVKVYPTATNVSISTGSAIQLMSLNGADNITFDGRINQTGATRDLTINQPYGHYGILAYNDADNLTFRYLKIKVNRLAIWITNYDGIAGNDNITIENNEFSNGHTGYTDAVTVRFQGQSANINNNAVVRNNLFSNILQKGYQTYGVYFENYTSNYEISGNSFYETTPVVPIHNQVLTYIHAANTIAGSTALITNNYMGGSAPQCGGSPFTWVGNPAGTTGNSSFWMVELNNSTGAIMNVTNNTIKNFDYSVTASGIFRCFKIYSNTGTLNLSGNTIGSATESNSISYMAKANGGAFYGIDYAGTGTGIIENNTIGGITCKNENADYSTHFYGITVSGNPIIRNNIIGSETVENNIVATSSSTSNPQYVYAINSTGTGATFSNNVISNLTNGTTSSTNTVYGRIAGINLTSGYININQNRIEKLKISNANNSVGNTCSVSGISYTGSSSSGTISGNIIKNLQNTFNGFTGEVTGILFSGSSGNVIEKNFINSLTTSGTTSNATVYGIKAITGSSSYSNNIITLGDNTSNKFYGIYDTGTSGQTCNIYHNTIYISGTPAVGSDNSSALYSNASSNTRNYRNNLLWNARSNNGATGKHYAAYYNYATATNLTNNYNNYYTTGTGGVLAYYNTADRTTLADLRTALGQDTKSISMDPVLATAGGLEEDDYIPDYRKLIGTSGTGISTDFAGITRKSTPTMGAYEIELDLPVQVWKAGVMEASYINLKNAFDKINDGTHKGILEIRITESVEETASAVLYQSGYNATSDYTAIHIFPTASGISVSGNLATPMISFNGADNVVVDGRVNATGTDKDLTIVNFSTSGSTGTTTIQFVNDASDNTVKYCTLKGSSTWYSVGGGVVYIGTSTGTTGNDNITIDNCNITNSLDANRPRIAIYCNGSSTALSNDNFTLSNCNIYDFFHRTTQASGSVFSYGIVASYNSSLLSIINNSFYETTSFVSSGSAGSYYVMSINNSLNNFNISGNYIGGSAPLCGGTSWTKTGDNTAFYGIYAANNGNFSENYVQNNVIRNINWTNTGAAQWCGISVGAADAGLLTVRNNTVGSGTGTGSIVFNSGLGGSNFYGMYSFGTILFDSNTIGSITTANQPAYATNTYGIYKHTGNCRYINNLIGSLTTPNSINASSTSTDQPQYVMGIYISNSATTLEISNNTVANITNATTCTTTSMTGILNGITVYANPTALVTGNTVFNLTISNANTNNNQNASLGGIVINNLSNKHTVTDNKIYNLTNNYSNFAGYIYGLYFTSANYTYTSPSTVARNFIHDIYATGASSTNANIVGIGVVSGNATYTNNVVSLGGNTQSNLYGIYDFSNTSDISNIYFNTINISGSVSEGTNKSYALYSASINGNRDYRNNILANTRSTNGGSNLHYAVYYNYAATTRLTNNYNNYFIAGEGTTLAYYASTNISTLAGIKSAIGQDVYSLSKNPVFVVDDGGDAIEYKPSAYNFRALTISGITTDYQGVLRDEYPTMGAFEGEYNIVEVYINDILQGSYYNLRRAFNKINDGTHQGIMDVRINDNTLEDASAVLYHSGYNSTSNYTSIHIFPTASGLSVSGNLNAPMIDFNGADNVTFDGRVNGTGNEKDLTVVNTNTSSTTITSTLRMINDATYNTIKFCNLKGSNQGSGIVFLSLSAPSATYPLGNSYNTIDQNNFTNNNGVIPRNAIRADNWGTTGYSTNKSITVTNNYFYDLLPSSVIYFGNNSQSGSITGNSFYQTSVFLPTNSNACTFIEINSNTGATGYTVSNNYIGGTQPNCGGDFLTKTSSNYNTFYGINLGSNGSNIIENNVIKKIIWQNSAGSATWNGIVTSDAGGYNITNNTIGSTTEANSIQITNGNYDNTVRAFFVVGTIRNNNIGGITISNTGTSNRSHFYGIYCTKSSTIEGNLIGSLTVPNSINNNTQSLNSEQNMSGLFLVVNGGLGSIIARNNTIANLRNGTTSTTTSLAGRISGIWVDWGNVNIENNIIKNLSISNANSSSTYTASAGGIVINPYNNSWNFYTIITGNQITNIYNDKSDFSGNIHGIYYCANASASNAVSKNLISNLGANGSGSLNCNVYGIKAFNGTATYSNNIITLGDNSANTFYGVYDTGTASQTCNVYFNTVYLGGAPTSGSANSYAFYSYANSNTRNFRNNIFSNYRSNNGATGKHYAAYFNYATPGTFTLSNNNYYVSGVGGVLGNYASSDLTSLPLINGYDTYSISGNPYFTNAGGLDAVDYKLSFTKPIAVSGTGITVDFGNNTRSAYPAMGAWEFDGPNLWKGNISTDWANGYNWTAGYVPATGADITFDPYPMNHAKLDQDRIIGSLNNSQPTYRAVTNGRKLTVNGALNFTNNAQIDASASNSTLEFAGSTEAQYIHSGCLFEDKVFNLSVKNPYNVILTGTLRLLNKLSSESGVLDATTNKPTVVLGGSTQQNSSGATLLSGRAFNLTIDNTEGAILTGDMVVENTLTLQQGELSANNHQLTLHGNTVGNGGYISTNGTEGIIDYAGTSAQTIRRIKENTANAILITNTSIDGVTIVGTENSFGDLNTFNQVNIANGSRLNVAPGEKLTVNNDLINNGTFVLQSDNQGTATLLTLGTFTDGGTYRVQQHLTGSNNGSAPDGRFWYVSTPLYGATSATFNPTTGLNKLWTWNEPTQGYLQLTENNASLVRGKGYVARMGNTGAVEFSSSTLNNGDIMLSNLSWTGSSHVNRGYNLIGNPYPSYLNWKDVWVDPNTGYLRETGLPNKMRATIWLRSEGNTLYTYNPVADTYVTTNPQDGEVSDNNIQYIAPMQAFWVETFVPEMTDGSITFTNSMRSHQISSDHRLRAKSAYLNEKQTVKLQITDGTNSDETVVLFNTKASDTYDLYDSRKMSQNTLPQLYTKVGSNVLSINTLSGFSNERVVPLGFSVPASGSYSISANETANFAQGTQVLLLDNSNGSVTELTDGDEYNFTSVKTDSYNRFSLIFRSPGLTTDIDNYTDGNIIVFRNGDNKITVICNNDLMFNASVTVYNVTGQVLANKALSGVTTVVDNQFIPGVYIVKVNNGANAVSVKVIIE